MRIHSIYKPLAALVVLGTLAACGGSSYTAPAASTAAPAAAATGLVYTNPARTGWALVQNAASTPAMVVLDLVGPAGAKARGVGFNLASDGSVKFHQNADKMYVKDLGVFQLKLDVPNLYTVSYPDFYEPVLMVGGVKNGGKLLTVGLWQKTRFQPAQDVSVPVCQIAIEFSAAAALPAGTTVPLNLVRARIIPEDIGQLPALANGDFTDVLNKFRLEDIPIAIGTLTAK